MRCDGVRSFYDRFARDEASIDAKDHRDQRSKNATAPSRPRPTLIFSATRRDDRAQPESRVIRAWRES